MLLTDCHTCSRFSGLNPALLFRPKGLPGTQIKSSLTRQNRADTLTMTTHLWTHWGTWLWNLLPVCAADCMVGISPPGGRIPLRFRPGPSMGLEPLIKVWGLLHKQCRMVTTGDSDEQVTERHREIYFLTRRSWPRWWNWALLGWPWPATKWFPWWWTFPWWAGEWSWRAAAGSGPVAAGRRAWGGRAATGSEPWGGPKGWGSAREERRGSRRGAGSSTACWWVLGWMAWGSPILKWGKWVKNINLYIPIKFFKEELTQTAYDKKNDKIK